MLKQLPLLLLVIFILNSSDQAVNNKNQIYDNLDGKNEEKIDNNGIKLNAQSENETRIINETTKLPYIETGSISENGNDRWENL